VLPALFAACGEAGDSAEQAVTIEPIASATSNLIPTGGKPAAPSPSATPSEPEFEAESADSSPTEPPLSSSDAPVPASTPAPALPTSTPEPPGPPATGRWIDVDVTNYVVRLMDGPSVVQEIAPVGVGVQIDTGEYLSTQTGLFYVNSKDERLVYDAPFNTYISHWVGFDAAKDNGFHSLLKDANGAVVDASTGRVSNGCIRTAQPEAVFAFAEIGMPVWVHW
jgi:hypothetical protein